MKLKSIFKKETKIKASKVQPLDKNQLEKVIGGAEQTNYPTIVEVTIKPIRFELK